MRTLQTLAADHPDSAVVRLNLGLALLAEGDLEAAQSRGRRRRRPIRTRPPR